MRTQPGQSENGQVGVESQPSTVDSKENQSADFNNCEFEEVASQEIPENAICEVDFRRIRPTTRRGVRDVRDALLSARLDFRRKTGFEPPDTPEDECYAVQHNIIQKAARKVWLLDSQPPALCGFDSWTVGFGNWHKLKNPHNSSDALFANFKQLVPELGLPW